MTNVYHRKLYALMHETQVSNGLTLTASEHEALEGWWREWGQLLTEISRSSDRIALQKDANEAQERITLKHLISGQKQTIPAAKPTIEKIEIPAEIDSDPQKSFWWAWRFLPEIWKANFGQCLGKSGNKSLLYPADLVLPDCPQLDYATTVSAVAGAFFPEAWSEHEQEPSRPYLLLFTFSPVQEFIKASRKFLDFWAGSYLLHYLSAKLCWTVALKYGPDAVITPSLWGQEIIDAFICQNFPEFRESFRNYTRSTPAERFNLSNSLVTAGFPNFIVAIAPSERAAQALGQELEEELKNTWEQIGVQIRETIKKEFLVKLEEKHHEIWSRIKSEFTPQSQDVQSDDPRPSSAERAKKELFKWQHGGSWEWNKLWNAQINHTWEAYWTAIPFGDPKFQFKIQAIAENQEFASWKQAQGQLAQTRDPIPDPTEERYYTQNRSEINVGTWWGSFQHRLGQTIQAIKNNRTWQIPVAPGERSTISGQYSAVHPNFLYKDSFRSGGGLPANSMRLFWRTIKEVFPGLFNGSEKLNALELTKRMAWGYGGVAESLGINMKPQEKILTLEDGEEILIQEDKYDKFVRFPNLSSIAAARFLHDDFTINQGLKTRKYWKTLRKGIGKCLPEVESKFCARTRGRPTYIPKTDLAINPDSRDSRDGRNYNGVMFSSKWLAEDLDLDSQQSNCLRGLVDKAHQECGFNNSSPADWWAIVLADGDNMGRYVSGRNLHPYREYVEASAVAEETHNLEGFADFLRHTKKRMGPATHVGLNRALLDFSNRLVPHLTENRYCGKVIYSGGDDVMAILPLEDLLGYLRSLRAAWCGGIDPDGEFDSEDSGYWHPTQATRDRWQQLEDRPYFTMGNGATMSMGVVIAHKSVPLPTVLETLWSAEKEGAKKMPAKDGLCFRVIYSSGNILEALIKGHLFSSWCEWVETAPKDKLSPLLYRLAQELPRRCCVTASDRLFRQAAQVILSRRDESKQLESAHCRQLLTWLEAWETWAYEATAHPKRQEQVLGTHPEDLGKLLRFAAFWSDRTSTAA